MQILSLYGLRNDGRKPEEIRKIKFELGLISNANGSCKYEIGNTEVMVTINGPHQITVKQPGSLTDNGIINCQVFAAYFSANSKPRKINYTMQEFGQDIAKALESVVMVDLLPKTQIDVFIEVIKNDGSVLSSCINASSLALMNAGVPMSAVLVSTTVGVVTSQFKGILNMNEQFDDEDVQIDSKLTYLIDLNGLEDSAASRLSSNINNLTVPGLCLVTKINQIEKGESALDDSNKPTVIANDIQSLQSDLVTIDIQQRIPFHLIEPSIDACEIACKRIYTILNDIAKNDFVSNYPEHIA